MGEVDESHKRGKIYTIRCYSDENKVYVGSTIDTLSRRLTGHRTGKTPKYGIISKC